jgi:hypothetical protein
LLLVAAQAPDWLQLLLAATGRDDPNEIRSHSIPVVAIGAIVFATYYVVSARDWPGALLLLGVALTHPILDLVTGAKVLWPHTARVGACLYDRPGLDFALEAGIALAGWAAYRVILGPRRSARGSWAILATLIASQFLVDGAQEARLVRNPGLRHVCVDATRG